MRKYWWKILCALLLIYAIVAGMLIDIPNLPVIHESIRNLFYHVGMWFAMMVVLLVSCYYSVKVLYHTNLNNDIISAEAVNVGLLFGVLGLITGSIWARFTWGKFWTNDPQLNGAAVVMLAYMAYGVLRRSIDDEIRRAKVSAVYNVLAFVIMVLFIGVLPRLSSGSLHPGKGGGSATVTTLSHNLQVVFYPAILGWILLAVWIMQIRVRLARLKRILLNSDYDK